MYRDYLILYDYTLNFIQGIADLIINFVASVSAVYSKIIVSDGTMQSTSKSCRVLVLLSKKVNGK